VVELQVAPLAAASPPVTNRAWSIRAGASQKETQLSCANACKEGNNVYGHQLLFRTKDMAAASGIHPSNTTNSLWQQETRNRKREKQDANAHSQNARVHPNSFYTLTKMHQSLISPSSVSYRAAYAYTCTMSDSPLGKHRSGIHQASQEAKILEILGRCGCKKRNKQRAARFGMCSAIMEPALTFYTSRPRKGEAL
jgi:hypothetical protein